uniref:CAP-Gly domain-containing protein n=1 Tax=Plectus sambesii TaxID=2011161 RepID=A0A914WB15_9BILA
MKQKRKGDGIIVRLQERQQWKQHNFVPGSRIVWFDDKSQAQPGTVLWIGEINGQTGVFAGVNFDNPIGSGANGRLSGRQLFKAKLDHAAFVQTHGLFSEEEYLELATSNKSTAKAITNNQEVEICDKADPEAAIARKELAVGDRIAWLDLTVTPQFGTIRWIGRLESHEHLFAEIDFDEPLVCLSSYNAASTQNSNGANGRSGFLQVDHIVREEDYRAEHNVRDVQEFQDCGWVDVSDDNHKQTKSIATDQKSKENCSDSEKPVNVITETHKLQQTENDVQGPLSDEGIVESDSAMGPIREGERIEWVDPDEQSYFGVVKWIGRLSGYSHI